MSASLGFYFIFNNVFRTVEVQGSCLAGSYPWHSTVGKIKKGISDITPGDAPI